MGTLIGIRCHKDFLSRVDGWRAKQEGDVSRPDAIRKLAEIGLQKRVRAAERGDWCDLADGSALVSLRPFSGSLSAGFWATKPH
jgi:hypothetical protein